MNILIVFGTRPEAIKLAPVIMLMREQGINVKVCVTGQHREMLDQMLRLFSIVPDYDLDIMKSQQTLADISSAVMANLDAILAQGDTDLVVVQGDTTSAFVAALTAFYRKIPVAHVEAGLRTDNIYDPFPEEGSRRLISQIATLNFAPTEQAKKNLEQAGVLPQDIYLTGNTVIDALLWVHSSKKQLVNEKLEEILSRPGRKILLTTHRRENIGGHMEEIFTAVNKICNEFADIEVIFPVHLNPVVQTAARKALANNQQVSLVPPLEYSDLVKVMSESYLIMTDSGGIQEEAPALGKPVVILRNTTERQEGVDSGTAILAGTKAENIYNATKGLLEDRDQYQRMAVAVNPYGDGHAAERICQAIKEFGETINQR